MFELNYGSKKIFYSLQQSERKTLSIEVYPDCSVNVLATTNATNLKIKEVLVKRSVWIIKQ